MREIKFRAWNGSKVVPVSELRQDFDALNSPKGDVYVPSMRSVQLANGDYLKFDPMSSFDDRLMQYTGLKDKNGVEIYEGDIVREYPDNEGYWVRVIEYNGHGFVLSKMASFLQHEIDWSKQVEVIGNVYENPELLGGDKAVQS